MKTSMLFLRRNIREYRSIFISVVLFIFVINIISIFLIGMTSGLNEQVIDNDNLNIMEVYPNEAQHGLSADQLADISKIEGVFGVYYTEAISVECVDKTSGEMECTLSIFKLDHEFLKYYGLPETDSDTYFYANKTSIPDVKAGEEFIAYKNDLSESEDVVFKVTDVVDFPNTIEKLIPSDMSFCDPQTFDKLLKNCDSWYSNEEEYSARLSNGATVHMIVPDVTKQNEVAEKIRKDYSDISVYYVLESAAKLPVYAETFVKIGCCLLIALLLFYVISIRNNLSHILNVRLTGIKLFNVLGVEPHEIVRSFYCEFVVLGLIAWVVQLVLTLIAFAVASSLFDVEVYKTAFLTVIVGNVVLLIVSVGIEGYIAIRHNIYKILSSNKSA